MNVSGMIQVMNIYLSNFLTINWKRNAWKKV